MESKKIGMVFTVLGRNGEYRGSRGFSVEFSPENADRILDEFDSLCKSYANQGEAIDMRYSLMTTLVASDGRSHAGVMSFNSEAARAINDFAERAFLTREN